MKKSVGYFLILNLFLSVVAFSFILNIGVVDAADKKEVGTETVPPPANTPSSLPVPSHGYAGQGYESFFGKGETAPAGTILGKDPKTGEVFEFKSEQDIPEGYQKSVSQGGGYTASGILQGASWALLVAGAVQAFAPMFGADADMTNALSKSIGGGVMAGKN